MVSIRDSINGISIANNIRMLRPTHEGSFLLVEGSTDAGVMKGFCESDNCMIVVCVNRSNLIDAMNELGKSDFPGIVALADRDYATLTGYPVVNGKVVYTDENDLEMTILHSPALCEVLEAFGSEAKVEAVTGSIDGKIVELLCESASVVGTLRLLSQRNGWNLRFEKMTYQFKRGKSFSLDERATVQHLLGRSEMWGKLDEEMLVTEVENRDQLCREHRELCNGHDCVHVLGKALRGAIGNEEGFANPKGVARLEAVLRLAYKFRHFRSSRVYDEIREWEKSTGYKVFISPESSLG